MTTKQTETSSVIFHNSINFYELILLFENISGTKSTGTSRINQHFLLEKANTVRLKRILGHLDMNEASLLAFMVS